MKKLFVLGLALIYFTAKADLNADLLKACSAGNLAEVKSLVDKGADVNYAGATATPISSSLMFADVLKFLIEKGAKLAEDNSPLVTACNYGSPEVIKVLLDAGADPNKPLVTDISKSIQKMVDDEKAKGKAANKAMIKAWEGMVETMKKTPVTTYALTQLVTMTNCLDCMKMLVDKGCKTDYKSVITGGNLLHEFATSGRSKKVRAESNKTVMAPALEKYGMTIPDWYKNPDESKMASPDDIAKFLVSKGVDINAKNTLNNAPLMEALVLPASVVQEEVVVALLNNGADVKIESILYGKPMLIAAGLGSIPIMDALLSKGAKINDEFSVDDKTTGQQLKGVTLLMWACSNDHLDAVKYLISKGVDLKEEAHGRAMNMKTKCVTKVEGKHAMYFAIETGNIEIVKALLDAAGGWTKALLIQQMKQESDFGAFTVTKCFDIGAYIPSKYAKMLGFEEIQKLLKSKLI
jgi:ankyrin repeat protein